MFIGALQEFKKFSLTLNTAMIRLLCRYSCRKQKTMEDRESLLLKTLREKKRVDYLRNFVKHTYRRVLLIQVLSLHPTSYHIQSWSPEDVTIQILSVLVRPLD